LQRRKTPAAVPAVRCFLLPAAPAGLGRAGAKARYDFARLRSALEVLERTASGHTVASFDPDDGDERGPVRRTTRRSSRGRQRPTPRGRRTIRENEEDLEEVVSTSRRRAMRGADMAGDRLEIEVGSVQSVRAPLQHRRGASWMVGLSLLLWWVPVLGPATVGYIGGRKSGGPIRAAVASLIPIMAAFFIIATLTSSTLFVPLVIKHFITIGYQAILGALPFDFPIMAYILSNLAAIMNSGPDTLFTVLAFAVVGGQVTRMKIQERSVPPITARFRQGERSGRVTARLHATAISKTWRTACSDLLDRAGARTRAPTAGAPPKCRGSLCRSRAPSRWLVRPPPSAGALRGSRLARRRPSGSGA